jgi:hypothetical protein
MDYCLVYLSSASNLLSEDELTNILHRSRQKNSESGITGILLYFNGNIIQVLEGKQEEVNRVYDKIRQDPRHNQIIELYKSPIEQRAFPAWLMGYKTLSTYDMEHLGELMPFTGSPLLAIKDRKNIVLRLVQLFYQNNYHN